MHLWCSFFLRSINPLQSPQNHCTKYIVSYFTSEQRWSVMLLIRYYSLCSVSALNPSLEVIFQTIRCWSWICTMGTFIGLFSSVDSLMLPERRHLWTGVVALVAFMGLLFAVLLSYMPQKIAFWEDEYSHRLQFLVLSPLWVIIWVFNPPL